MGRRRRPRSAYVEEAGESSEHVEKVGVKRCGRDGAESFGRRGQRSGMNTGVGSGASVSGARIREVRVEQARASWRTQLSRRPGTSLFARILVGPWFHSAQPSLCKKGAIILTFSNLFIFYFVNRESSPSNK